LLGDPNVVVTRKEMLTDIENLAAFLRDVLV
jgi:hypothetical protein